MQSQLNTIIDNVSPEIYGGRLNQMRLLSARIKWAMQNKSAREGIRVTGADIMRATGASRTAVSFWMNDKNGIDGENARKAAAVLGVDPVWLETGEGSPLPKSHSRHASAQEESLNREQVNANDVIELLALFQQSTDKGRGFILDSARNAAKVGALQWTRSRGNKS